MADSRTGDRSTTESAPVAVTVLSEAEQRVAALAVRGYTNRDIAAQLYLTVSTVEQHLTRTFRKLKVSRRRDLPTNLDSCRYTDLRYSRMHA
ncbi:helix-turn-helix domain-containing protein [Actinoplanes regularis]|uniref:helix-turn-helix domain-containing protein n=1 Tax=Actinoplanes regularis TaxID=52697 RepID=UPI0035A2228B